jgi:uncharacterized membrane protein YbaN (DUF454 family)
MIQRKDTLTNQTRDRVTTHQNLTGDMMRDLRHAKAMPLQVKAVAIQKALKTAEMVLLTETVMIIVGILTKKTTTTMDLLTAACQ